MLPVFWGLHIQAGVPSSGFSVGGNFDPGIFGNGWRQFWLSWFTTEGGGEAVTADISWTETKDATRHPTQWRINVIQNVNSAEAEKLSYHPQVPAAWADPPIGVLPLFPAWILAKYRWPVHWKVTKHSKDLLVLSLKRLGRELFIPLFSFNKKCTFPIYFSVEILRSGAHRTSLCFQQLTHFSVWLIPITGHQNIWFIFDVLFFFK